MAKSKSELEVKESPVEQSAIESIARTFDWSNIGTPTSPTVSLYNLTDGVALDSSDYLTGTASVSSDNIITPHVHSLVAGTQYKLICTVTVAANTLTSYLRIIGVP